MKLTLELNNQTKSPIKKSFFNAVAERTLEEFFKLRPRKSKFEDMNFPVSVALVDREEIKRLNKTYRKKNQVTDVLSFAEYQNIKELEGAMDNQPHRLTRELFLGELVLCYDDIEEYAKKENIALDKELANVVSHGMLHLLGMRHGKKMFEMQDKVKNSLSSCCAP